jgi:ubiquinone/menaquinone biosynthesis C-methylase UbiE
MSDRNGRVCPAEHARFRDNKIRRWLQDPKKILAPYVNAGMCVLDFGCGPGFFTIDMAEMVGKSGRVIASDLQEGMLEKVQRKIQGTPLENIISLHQCQEKAIGLEDQVDFIMAFYVVHEVPDQQALFAEIATILNSGGRVFVVEPSLHVSKKAFETTIAAAQNAGLAPVERPKVFFSKAVILQKAKS